MMAKALIVSSSFPPIGSVGGTIRLVKLLKYMANMGWEFVVFTQDPEHLITPEPLLSGALLNELPSNILVVRVPDPLSLSSLESRRFSARVESAIKAFFKKMFGDSAVPWGLSVFFNGLAHMRQSQIDVVFGTAPPFTNALIAMLLGWVGRKPFVLDMRDDWVGLPIFLQKNIVRQKLEILLEGLIVRQAAAFITVTPQSHHLYKERYSNLRELEKFHLIPNGTDLDEYSDLEKRVKNVQSGRFLILSAAWWYRKDRRDISPFLFALDAFLKRRPEAREKVEVVLLGNSLSPEYAQMLVDLTLDRLIQQLGSVNRKELVEWLWKADLFLLVQPIGNKTAISGTLYEYWATGKAPILLISEEGASSALVEENAIGRRFQFDQVEQISHYIEKQFDAFEAGQPVWIEREGVQKFDRKYIAKCMADVWQNLIEDISRN